MRKKRSKAPRATREIGRGLAVVAVVAVAATALLFFSGAALATSSDAEDDRARRLAALPPGLAEIDHAKALPRVLSETDRVRYKKIFTLQDQGDWAASALVIEQLEDPLLMGHVLAQKYLHPTAYRSKFGELRLWLKDYGDHPDARRIYRLALKRRPAGAAKPLQPLGQGRGLVAFEAEQRAAPPVPRKNLSRSAARRLANLQQQIRSRTRRGWPTGALQVANSGAFSNLASPAQMDEARSRIAWSYYLYNKDAKAFGLASASAARARLYLPEADWIAGLAAWRLGDLALARGHFEALAESRTAPRELASAGAFWAARAHLKTRQPEHVSHWLTLAAQAPRTFYGMIAARALGLPFEFNWRSPPLTEVDLESAMRAVPVRRAMALVEVGQQGRAEKEIRKAHGHATPALSKALMPLAARLSMPSIQMALSGRRSEFDGRRHDGAAYPLPAWEPVGGFVVDRALLFALIRQESKFISGAKSRRGARGVMQLMPRTARFAATLAGLEGVTRHDLYSPEINIALGQSYVRYLLTHERVNGNLFFLLAAYNGGPANLAKWQTETNFNDDLLLFIESIRSRETRSFIERVLTNYWIYRLRLGQATPSLDAAASGRWPLYVPQETAINVADNE
jgi:soluble lytic murein transglycosylase-like protein